MTPALSGANCYETDKDVFIIGGQDLKDKATNLISKVQRVNPTSIEKAAFMQVPRVDAFAFTLDNKIVIMGGSEKPLIEAFDPKNLQPEKGLEAKSDAFFKQLACYTGDFKLENSSVG